jgi:parvulin-like peptidyl-prolyl isomerase
VFRSRVWPRAVLISLGFLGISSRSAAEPPPVERTVVNRIVAVVDQDVITLVELKRRAEPFQKRLADVAPDKRAAAETQLHKDLIQEAIEDRLIARDARALRVSIGSDEINRALDSIAQSKNVTREKLLQLVAEQGFSEAQYREQLVRQLLIGKLIRIKKSDELKKVDKEPDKANKQIEKIEKAYLLGLRANVFIEVRL